MKVFLIGMMGCGKSYWAQKLAEKTDTKWTDLDENIVRFEKKTISEIIKTQNWDYFRLLEQKILKKITKKNITFIATGGGTPCYFDNLEVMKNNGQVVYLKTPVELIFQRLMSGDRERPLLKNKPPEKLFSYLQNLLSEREVYYQKAHYIASQSPDNQLLGDEILEYLKTQNMHFD